MIDHYKIVQLKYMMSLDIIFIDLAYVGELSSHETDPTTINQLGVIEVTLLQVKESNLHHPHHPPTPLRALKKERKTEVVFPLLKIDKIIPMHHDEMLALSLHHQ